ncbi:MAG: hypothetical protein OEX22_09110 [Cyclobacteriaceae bacterium]|nr:hypothetical protein [Cyclobacteriaceae bacterium]
MRKNRILYVAILTIALSSFSFGQKIKYKDLFYLLNAKKYEEAEPFLKSFLKNSKNADHPNANFQMAIIYNEKSKNKDLLTETEEKIIFIDSAVYFYNFYKTLITEKDIKKNDEYYADYYRRDLRTGKMGVKISDIHLDVDTRVSALSEDIETISSLKNLFVKSETYYSKAQSGYASLVGQYHSQKQFYLRADKDILNKIGQIKMEYDSSMGAFGKYKIALAKIKSSSYNQRLEVKQIVDIKEDGSLETNFLSDELLIWNYDKWAEEVIGIIEEDIIPMQNKLVEYDKNLSLLYKKVQEKGVSVVDDLQTQSNKIEEFHIEKYEKNAFPVALFSLKHAELEYLSTRLEANKVGEDTVDIDRELELTSKSLLLIEKMDSIIGAQISSFDISKERLNFKPLFDEQLGGVEEVEMLIKNKKDLVAQEQLQLKENLETLKENSQWLIYRADSIPLFEKNDTSIVNLSIKNNLYVYLNHLKVNDSLRFTFGINYDFNRAPNVYFSTITPSHQIDTLYKFGIDSTAFSIDSLQNINVMKAHDREKGTYVLLYSANYFDKPLEAHLFKVNNNLTLDWEKFIMLLYPPDVLTISEDFGVIAINYNIKYIDKSKGLQLIARVLYDMSSGEAIKEKN